MSLYCGTPFCLFNLIIHLGSLPYNLFAMVKNLLVVLISILFVFDDLAQDTKAIVVTGKVIDKKTNEAVVGATISEKGSTSGTLTDIDGNFSLSVSSNASVIVVSYIGFKSVEQVVGNQAIFNISIEEDAKNLEEIVVTALAIKRDKKELGIATQEIKTQELTDSKETNIINSLSAKVAGMQVNATSGSPGAAARFRLRGSGSIGGNDQALMVVDGIPIDNGGGEDTRTLEGSNRGVDINPNDVASVTILKGPAASALYGIRARNGAIMITTKGGQAGKTTVDYSGSIGFDEVNKLPERQTKYAGGNDGNVVSFDDRQSSSSAPSRSWGPAYSDLRYDGIETKWDKRGSIIPSTDPNLQRVTPYDNASKLFTRGLQVNNYISISGGNEKTTFFLSAGNFRQFGVIPKQEFERSSIKLSGTNNVTKWLKFSASANYTSSNASRLRKGGDWSAPMVSLYRSPSDYDMTNGFSDAVNTPEAYQFDNGQQKKGAAFDNPFYSVNNNVSKERVNRLYGFLQADVEFIKDLKFLGRVGVDYFSTGTDETYGKFSSQNPLNGYEKGSYYESQSTFKSLNTDMILSYSKKVSDNFDFDVRVGHNYRVNMSERLSLQGYDFVFNNFNDFVNTDQSKWIPSWSDNKTLINAAYFDSKIGFKNYLFLNLTGRGEYTSVIPSRNGPYFTPAISTSFIFTEAFGIDNSVLNFGKLRLSAAQAANAPSAYITNTYFSQPVEGGFQQQTLFRSSSNAGNPYLKPEIQTTYEAGLELKFFNNRLNADIAYYDANNFNQIITAQIPASTGYQSSVLNNGNIHRTGLEILLNATPIKKDFQWDISLNFTRQRQIVQNLDYNNQDIGGRAGFSNSTPALSKAINGQQYGILVGATRYERYGQDPNDMTIRNDLKIVVDANGVPVIQSAPTGKFYIVGNPNPDWFGGIRNTFSYKGFTLSALVDVKQGGDMFNLTRLNMIAMGTAKETENRGTQVFPNSINADGTPNTKEVPMTYAGVWGRIGGDFGGVPERGIEDGSWYRLRELTLKYRIPEKITSKVFIKNASIALTGRNLILVTKYTGVDPETNASGNDASLGRDAYNNPNTRSYVFTLNLTF